jgi:hypothetical protein
MQLSTAWPGAGIGTLSRLGLIVMPRAWASQQVSWASVQLSFRSACRE